MYKKALRNSDIVISRKGQGISEMYTVRKISSGIGVERTFPIHTPRGVWESTFYTDTA